MYGETDRDQRRLKRLWRREIHASTKLYRETARLKETKETVETVETGDTCKYKTRALRAHTPRAPCNCVIVQYCQPFDHFEVRFDHIEPANHDSNDSTLFYFPVLRKSERKESIVTPDDFNYYIGYFIECESKLEYFPPRFLYLLFLRLAYSYALQAAAHRM